MDVGDICSDHHFSLHYVLYFILSSRIDLVDWETLIKSAVVLCGR